MSKQRNKTLVTLGKLGFTADEAATLIRASARLHSWAEHECNGVIQRDEKTNIPYWHSSHDGKRIGRAPDAETGALKRAKDIAARHGYLIYHQGDPRGCALYLYRQKELDAYASRVMRPEQRNEASIDSCYSSVGFAVCP